MLPAYWRTKNMILEYMPSHSLSHWCTAVTHDTVSFSLARTLMADEPTWFVSSFSLYSMSFIASSWNRMCVRPLRRPLVWVIGNFPLQSWLHNHTKTISNGWRARGTEMEGTWERESESDSTTEELRASKKMIFFRWFDFVIKPGKRRRSILCFDVCAVKGNWIRIECVKNAYSFGQEKERRSRRNNEGHFGGWAWPIAAVLFLHSFYVCFH